MRQSNTVRNRACPPDGIRLRAHLRKADEDAAVEEFEQTLMTLHEHLAKRRTFIQDELKAESSQ